MTETPDWWIYRGKGRPHDRIARLPAPPPWRVFDRSARQMAPDPPPVTAAENASADTYLPDPDVVELVNAAIYLRRPMLVAGKPGTGKSTLASAIARELGLGRVLRWHVTSRTTRRDGLYQYDPMGRLYATSRSGESSGAEEVGQYIRLGALGTAMLPSALPRVLLIDEIDKGDLDLPNDLLTLFEDGTFEIPELMRQTDQQQHLVRTADENSFVEISGGSVRCHDFPIVVMTSNEEREFPPAFLRRCIQIDLAQPDGDKLKAIVKAHLGQDLADGSDELISAFLSRQTVDDLATDQLLNAIFLTDHVARSGADRLKLAERVMTQLSRRPDDR